MKVRIVVTKVGGAVLETRDFADSDDANEWLKEVIDDNRFGLPDRWIDEHDAQMEHMDLRARTVHTREDHGHKSYFVTGDYTVDVIAL